MRRERQYGRLSQSVRLPNRGEEQIPVLDQQRDLLLRRRARGRGGRPVAGRGRRRRGRSPTASTSSAARNSHSGCTSCRNSSVSGCASSMARSRSIVVHRWVAAGSSSNGSAARSRRAWDSSGTADCKTPSLSRNLHERALPRSTSARKAGDAARPNVNCRGSIELNQSSRAVDGRACVMSPAAWKAISRPRCAGGRARRTTTPSTTDNHPSAGIGSPADGAKFAGSRRSWPYRIFSNCGVTNVVASTTNSSAAYRSSPRTPVAARWWRR